MVFALNLKLGRQCAIAASNRRDSPAPTGTATTDPDSKYAVGKTLRERMRTRDLRPGQVPHFAQRGSEFFLSVQSPRRAHLPHGNRRHFADRSKPSRLRNWFAAKAGPTSRTDCGFPLRPCCANTLASKLPRCDLAHMKSRSAARVTGCRDTWN